MLWLFVGLILGCVIGWLIGIITVSAGIVKRKDEIVSALGQTQYDDKTGHWRVSNIPNEKYVCSVCGGACWYYDYEGDVSKSPYCPNCGARMEEYK